MTRKITLLHEKVVKKKFQTNKIEETQGYFYNTSGDWLKELSDIASRFMQKYDIGQHLSSRKWQDKSKDMIKDVLKNTFTMFGGKPNERNAEPMEVYDDLKDKFSKDYSPSEVAVVARTETANLRAIMSLTKFQEAGFEKVRHKTKNDNRVSDICKSYQNRVFEIDYLLKQRGLNNDRIAIHPNCRCRYEPAI